MSKTAVKAGAKKNPAQFSAAAPVKVTRHFRGAHGATENLRARRRGQTDMFSAMDWKRNPINFTVTKKGDFTFARIKDQNVLTLASKFGTRTTDGRVKFNKSNYSKFLTELNKKFEMRANPATQSADFPVGVKAYYRQEPASLHVLARRKGQSDLFPEMDWKRNPAANFLESCLVRHSQDKTIVTTPGGERLTFPGTLTRAAALKRASRHVIKNNPAFEGENREAAAEFLDNLIDALDVENDGDLDAGDVERFRDFDDADGEPEEEVKIEIDGDDYLNELFGDGDGDEQTAEEVTEADGERDGVIVDETRDGHLVVAWIDDDGEEVISIEHPENVLFVGEPNDLIQTNPPKYILSGLKISTGKRVFIKFDTEALAKRKRLKLEKTGNFENLRIRPTGNYPAAAEVKNNPDLISTFANLAVGLASSLAIGKEIKNAAEREKNAAQPARARKNPVSKTKAKPTKARTRKNPGGVNFEMFSGRQSTKKTEARSSQFAPKNLEFLGDLIEIKLIGNGEPLSFVEKNSRFPFMLCADGNGRMHIVGKRIASPDSSLQSNELSSFGEMRSITYRAQKAHLGDTKPTFYKHDFGEEGGTRPELCADRQGYAVINGGTYRIKPDYDGKHSSGIRD
jgi:hypothetical protein